LHERGAGHAVEKALKNLNTKHVYLSLDVDIGSLSSVYACRFLSTIGLSLDEIREVFQSLFNSFSGGLTLAGFDLMEVDIHKLGAKIDSSHVDQTGEVGRLFLDLIGKVVSGNLEEGRSGLSVSYENPALEHQVSRLVINERGGYR
jgi:arginase family enzyme